MMIRQHEANPGPDSLHRRHERFNRQLPDVPIESVRLDSIILIIRLRVAVGSSQHRRALCLTNASVSLIAISVLTLCKRMVYCAGKIRLGFRAQQTMKKLIGVVEGIEKVRLPMDGMVT
jgi:hypothetical protein